MTHPRAPYLVRPLDACLRPEQLPAQPSFDVHKSDVPERRRAVVQRVIEVAFPRVVEHLALAPETWEAEGRRGVWLWGVLEISAAADGTDLRLDYVSDDPDADGCSVTANLTEPINRFGFAAAMSPILVAAARECGLHPKTLPGPTGMYIRRVFARTFNGCVDWNRLRRGCCATCGSTRSWCPSRTARSRPAWRVWSRSTGSPATCASSPWWRPSTRASCPSCSS